MAILPLIVLALVTGCIAGLSPPASDGHEKAFQDAAVKTLYYLRREIATIISELRGIRQHGSERSPISLSVVIRRAKLFQRHYNAALRILRQERPPTTEPPLTTGPPTVGGDSSLSPESCLYLIGSPSVGGGAQKNWERHAIGNVRGCSSPDAVIGWRCTAGGARTSAFWSPILCKNYLDAIGQPTKNTNPTLTHITGKCLGRNNSIYREGEVDCSGPVLRQCRRLGGATSRYPAGVVDWSVDVIGLFLLPHQTLSQLLLSPWRQVPSGRLSPMRMGCHNVKGGDPQVRSGHSLVLG